MKTKIIGFTFLFCWLVCIQLAVKSQEISTNAQVYDYEIGDIFHYFANGEFQGDGYIRKIFQEVIDKEYLANGTILSYTIHSYFEEYSPEHPNGIYWEETETVGYTNLDQPVNDGDIDSAWVNPDDYNGRKINGISSESSTYSTNDYFVDGCGHAFESWTDMVFVQTEWTSLVYFKKGDDEWGDPLLVGATEHSLPVRKIIVYPNPARDHIYLHLDNEISKAVMADIYSLDGRSMKSINLKGRGENIVDISALPEGVYILNISDSNFASLKFAIRR